MNRQTFLLPLFIILVGLLSLCLFKVEQTQRAVVIRLGNFITGTDDTVKIDDPDRQHLSKVAIYEPGLHFKVPLIDNIHKFDTRLQILDIKSSRILTSEKKDVMVDLYVKWRIENLPQFFLKTEGMNSKVNRLLNDKIVSVLRAEFGKRTIKEVVSGERDALMSSVREQTDISAANLGVEVVDVRIKKIDLPEAVSSAVYERMRTERERVAAELKAQGVSEAKVIRAEAEKARRVILAEAEKQADEIKGSGEADSLKIYAEAFNRSPEFYQFSRTLDAYRSSFDDKSDILLLKPEGEFFKFFKEDR